MKNNQYELVGALGLILMCIFILCSDWTWGRVVLGLVGFVLIIIGFNKFKK